MATVTSRRKPQPASLKILPKGGLPARPPSARNCTIYERIRLEGETHEKVGADYAVSRQRIATIVAQVEGWLAGHPNHKLAQKMRVRCGKRWETLWARAIDSFDRSRQDREVKKQRTARRAARNAADELVTTITEHTVREQNGDPRYLNIAWRVAEREDRLWMPPSGTARPADQVDNAVGARPRQRSDDGATPPAAEANGDPPQVRDAALRFPHLPAALCDLEYLACGLRGATDGQGSGAEGRAQRESQSGRGTVEALPQPPSGSENPGAAEGDCGAEGNGLAPVSRVFEQRCAEAFRCLGFEVRELGQGCGRVADCLAVAVAERFAVIVDAKVRRRGYTLGTDDRQFCEYAARHTRELAQSGIERVYFAVVGRGFRQADLEKLAGFMTGTPIRSVAFIEVEALMRLVNDSIRRRREFRLAEVDQLLFGNKILEG